MHTQHEPVLCRLFCSPISLHCETLSDVRHTMERLQGVVVQGEVDEVWVPGEAGLAIRT